MNPPLADRLRSLLARKGYSISDAAEAAGMQRQACWRLVTGKVPDPRFSTVERLVGAVGGTMGELCADPDD